MKTKIIPITTLRDTSKIEKLVKENEGPIFVNKNGFEDMVLMSNKFFDDNFSFFSAERKESYENNLPLKQDDGSFFGFVRVMSPSIEVEVSNVSYNVEQVKKALLRAKEKNASIVNFQELTLSSYTCGDFFLTDSLLNACLSGLKELVSFSKTINIAFTIGLPLMVNNSLYNVAAFIYKGRILGIVPKLNIQNSMKKDIFKKGL